MLPLLVKTVKPEILAVAINGELLHQEEQRRRKKCLSGDDAFPVMTPTTLSN
jgi:hypothetical protein